MHAAIEDFGPTTLVEGSVTPVSIGASVDIASRFRAPSPVWDELGRSGSTRGSRA